MVQKTVCVRKWNKLYLAQVLELVVQKCLKFEIKCGVRCYGKSSHESLKEGKIESSTSKMVFSKKYSCKFFKINHGVINKGVK